MPSSDDTFSALETAYSEPHRHYHTLRHIDDCLAQLDAAAGIAEAPEEVEIALWFHDAVYRPTSTVNELESAEWARTFLRDSGMEGERSQRVFDHILATRHAADPPSNDARVVVDIDLSVLGLDTAAYEEFEQAIRKEYQWVPWVIYRRKRAEVLSSFLSRPRIYATEHFHDRLEASARQNLQRAIAALNE